MNILKTMGAATLQYIFLEVPDAFNACDDLLYEVS